jgi:hypothetical protein
MALQLPNKCPNCGLILLAGAIMDAAAKADGLGPILGLSRDVKPEEAEAGYVGMSSLWLADVPEARYLYLCPRCKTDLLLEVKAWPPNPTLHRTGAALRFSRVQSLASGPGR